MRRLCLVIWLALAGIQLAFGVAWLAQNLETVPDYGDTGDYLQLARTLEVDAYRGIAYPALIAGVDRLPGGAGLLRGAGKGSDGPRLKAGVLYLQVIQLLASLAALAYFVRVFVARLEPERAPPWLARGASVLLLLLLFLDPLVAHFGLALMTDGLALSASLAACAALAQLGPESSRRWLAGLVLLATFVLAASLRVEKLWVLACAALASIAAWSFLERRERPEQRTFTLARAAQIAVIVLVASLTVTWLHRSARVDSRRWPMVDSMLHARIVFPNLSDVYDQLPERIRSRVSRKDAAEHDTDSIVGFRVINKATGDSGRSWVRNRRTAGQEGKRPPPEVERRAMLETIAGVVLRERWLALAADVAKDALENVAATLSFYVRLAVLARTGDVSCADGTQKTYEVLSQRHPRISRAYVISSVVLVLASAALAGLALARRRQTGGPWIARRTLVTWVPVAAFVLANACAFALRADMVHIRYMLVAHVAFLALVFRGAIEWLACGRVTEGGTIPEAREDRAPAPIPPG